LNPFSIPLLNTVILLSSGATVTWSHHNIVYGKKTEAIIALIITIVLGLIFTSLQLLEYIEAPFCIADSVYGSIFFVATGFHGLHVIIGTIFLLTCLGKLYFLHFTNTRHFAFEAASWY
jgi:cytochrome c oxidase subunit 3